MWRWIWRKLKARYSWLNELHPIAYRDLHWSRHEMPVFFRRITNPWTLLGYAAVIHGGLFVVSIATYNQMGNSLANAFLPIFSPFLTPFGTPIAAYFLHSVLYWGMLIGICNQVTGSLGHEFESGTWTLLRLTPYTATNLLFTKLVGVMRNWMGVLRTLTIIRLTALLIIPFSVAAQRAREGGTLGALDWIGAGLFLLQPFAEAFLVMGLSALVTVLIRTTLWSKVYAYGLATLVNGGLNVAASVWLIFTSPIGALAGLLIPLGHWAPLVGSVVPPASMPAYTNQTIVLALTSVILPVIFGFLALRMTTRRLEAVV